MEMEEGDREIVSTLSIATTAPSVAGQYRCVAENGVTGVGDVNDITALLMVYGKSCMDSKECNMCISFQCLLWQPMCTLILLR